MGLMRPMNGVLLRTLIVDDEPPARALLREYLTPEAGVEVVGECANGFDAVKRVGELQPDLLFLDVQMPKLNGFEVLELLDASPAVVFCTAYDEYALKAFDVHAVDYLLKPFSRERLHAALTRVRERRAAAADGTAANVTAANVSGASLSAPMLAAAARPAGLWAERVVIKDGTQIHVIAVGSIDRLEAQGDYVLVCVGAQSWLKHQTLAELADTLDPACFIRVHRSHVVALDRIARLELYAKDSRVAFLRDGHEVPVSRSGHTRLRELI